MQTRPRYLSVTWNPSSPIARFPSRRIARAASASPRRPIPPTASATTNALPESYCATIAALQEAYAQDAFRHQAQRLLPRRQETTRAPPARRCCPGAIFSSRDRPRLKNRAVIALGIGADLHVILALRKLARRGTICPPMPIFAAGFRRSRLRAEHSVGRIGIAEIGDVDD